MTDVSLMATATSRRQRILGSGICMLLIAVGAVGVSSSAHAAALTVTGPALYYANYGPSPLPGGGEPPGEYIAYSAESVVPNGAAGATGVATTTNQNTQSTITRPINFLPGPIDPNIFWYSIAMYNNNELYPVRQ
jgi:hypothetical protein